MTAAPKLHITGGPCLAYIRVSTEDQARDERTSLADQRRAINTLATGLGLTVTDEKVFTDAGVSGATAEKRPAFMALVDFCKRNPQPIERPGHEIGRAS